MTSMFIFDLQVGQIDVPEDRARDFNPMSAALLAHTIAIHGLLHPIRVRRVGDRYRLISGRVRLEAHRLLSRDEIAASVSNALSDDDARLEEVMENLAREELIALDRCHHLFELKQVWERLHPEAKNGGDKNVKKGQEATRIPTWDSGTEVLGFAKAVAEKVGLSRTAISRAVKIWTDLTPDSRQRLAGTRWATMQSELVLLSAEKPKRQSDILDKLLAPNPRATSVSDAIGLLNNGALFDDVERKFLSANKVFAGLADSVLDRLVTANEERIIASLQRQGRN